MKRFSVGAATHAGVLHYLVGHEAPVRCLAASRDGKYVASGGEDQTARLWDVAARRQLHRLAHEGEVYAVALSSDGKRLASGGGDCVVRFWDAASGAAQKTFDGDSHVVTALAFDPSGERVLAGFDDGSLALLDAASGKRLKKLTGPTQAIWGVAFSPDGRRAASGDWEGKLIVWDLATGKRAAEREAHQRNFGGVGFSGDGRRVLYTVESAVHAAPADGPGEPVVLEEHQSALYAFALTPDGRHLLTGGGEGRDASIGLWDAEAGTLVHRYQIHDGGNRALALSADGKLGFSAGYHDRRVAVIDLASRPEVARAEGHTAALLCAAFAPAAQRVVTGGFDATLRVFDLASGAERAVVKLDEFVLPGAVEVSADGGTVVIADGGSLRAYDLASGAARATLEEVGGYPRFFALSPDGARAAVADERAVRVWSFDAKRGTKPLVLKGHKESIESLAFSADGALLASGDGDGAVRVWDARTGAAHGKPLKAHDGAVTALAFAPGGRLVSAGRDQQLAVWDLANGKSIARLEGHEQWVSAVAVSPDGERVLSCAEGERAGRVRLWDAASGRELARFNPHDGDSFRIAFSADGRRAYSISRDDRTVEVLAL